MRLWSIHPKYLDPQGLVAVWREALLAQKVLSGETKGYRNHPQLNRFKAHASPRAAVSIYLKAIYTEAETRGYSFDKSKIKRMHSRITLEVTTGQLQYEWTHFLRKVRERCPALYRKWSRTESPEPHPMFQIRQGAIESWERR